MRVDLSSINREQFQVKPGQIAGEEVFLTCPAEFSPDWSPENVIFRSSIWDKDGNPVSLGFKKFFNIGEKPHLGEFSEDERLNVLTKMDGSCIIVSKFKDTLVIRTRETISASIHPNYPEIKMLVDKHPRIAEFLDAAPEYSLIFEHTSPGNKVVINYPKPELTLLNVVSHETYGYMPQKMLDRLGASIGVPRPKTFDLSFEELKALTLSEREIEGWCIYYNGDQDIRKLKTSFYLACHRLKYSLSDKGLIELFVDSGVETGEEFRNLLAKTYDFEVLSVIDFSKFEEALNRYKDFENFVAAKMKPFIELPRKEMAKEITQNFGKREAVMAFLLFDKKTDKKFKRDTLKIFLDNGSV